MLKNFAEEIISFQYQRGYPSSFSTIGVMRLTPFGTNGAVRPSLFWHQRGLRPIYFLCQRDNASNSLHYQLGNTSKLFLLLLSLLSVGYIIHYITPVGQYITKNVQTEHCV